MNDAIISRCTVHQGKDNKQLPEPSMVMDICNPSTSEAKGPVQVPNEFRLHSKSQAILGYRERPCLKNPRGQRQAELYEFKAIMVYAGSSRL